MTKTTLHDWMVYIIETNQGALYTGITNNIERRVKQHREGLGAKFFRLDPPKQIVWCEDKHTRSSASRREAAIKKLSRQEKMKIIAEGDLGAL